MEPNVATFRPSRRYARLAYAAFAGSVVCALCALRAPLAGGIPAGLCAATAAGLLWLAKRPEIRLGDFQFNIGERAIAWREVREINTNRFTARLFTSPLVLHLKLTNSRRKALVFPGEPEQIAQLLFQLRKNCFLASFDGVPFREYWAGMSPNLPGTPEEKPSEPAHILSPGDEEEIERMYQKLKSVGHLDSKKPDDD